MNAKCIPLIHTDNEGNICNNLSFNTFKDMHSYEKLKKFDLD